MSKSAWVVLGATFLMVTGASAQTAQIQPAPAGAPAAQKQFADVPASHEKVADVAVKSTDGKHRLQTVSIDSAGRVLALAAPPKSFGPPLKGASAEVHVFTPDGKPANVLKLDFHANSVTGGPDGSIYVAGEGKVVRFSAEGKQLASIELPFIQQMLADKDGPRKAAEAQVKAQRQSMQQIVVQYKDRLKTLEAKKEEERTALEKRQIEQFRNLIKNYEPGADGKEDVLVEQMINQLMGRLRTINAITLSNKDAFIACGDTKGFGYAIWRLDHEFKTAKQILNGVRGCCGQMDIQCAGEELLIAENTNHRFARYDRDGKPMGAWGKRAAGAAQLDCFGGCCNPMNIRATSSGDIFTAESEGLIKRFSAKGDFLGLVATVPLTGAGCKNVAFAVSQDEQRIYFLDLNGSRFVILGKKAAAAK